MTAREARRRLLRRVGFALGLAVVALASGAACGGDEGDEGEVDQEGLQMCCDLGGLCHPDPDDAINSPKRACHALGHGNDPAACRTEYESCMDVCAGEPGEEPHFCG